MKKCHKTIKNLTKTLKSRGAREPRPPPSDCFPLIFLYCSKACFDCFESFLIVLAILRFLIKLVLKLFYCNLGLGPLVRQAVIWTRGPWWARRLLGLGTPGDPRSPGLDPQEPRPGLPREPRAGQKQHNQKR